MTTTSHTSSTNAKVLANARRAWAAVDEEISQHLNWLDLDTIEAEIESGDAVVIVVKADDKDIEKAIAEFKACKRNKSGSINENSRHAVRKRLAANLQARGMSYGEAWDVAYDLSHKHAAK